MVGTYVLWLCCSIVTIYACFCNKFEEKFEQHDLRTIFHCLLLHKCECCIKLYFAVK